MHRELVIRPVRESDLSSLVGVAKQLGPGFTSLPNNEKILEERVNRSLKSFSDKIEKNSRFYLFVMENLNTKKVVGTSAIQASIAYPWPFYNYKVSVFGQYSQSLKRTQESQILYLVSDYQGAAELGALFLDPAYRGDGRGEYLSRSRCLFIAEFQSLFPDIIIAEMRGVCDQQGVSPFWDAVGKRFFDMDFPTADYLRATEGNVFLSELMPKYPIYVDLLPEAAKQVIGKAHEKSLPAMHVLNKEGFQYKKYVDILNAGPTIEILKHDLRTLRDSRTVTISECREKLEAKDVMLMCNRNMDYRSVLGSIEWTDNGEGVIEENTARALNISIGDSIRFCYVR